MPLGLYLAIPFCRAKCTFCNFASDAFASHRIPAYVDRLTTEIASARTRAQALYADLPHEVDTLYFGGGTPSLLAPAHIQQIFAALRNQFRISPTAEITVECAPGQLSDDTLNGLLRQGVNRLSFGVQTFNPRETSAIGRLHSPEDALDELSRVRRAGIPNLSLDLIAGLPHQTEPTWRATLETAIATGVPHISVYMLEVDEDSRLGREVLARGPRYGAPTVPSDDQSADLYEIACDLLEAAGILQYEISNFAQPGHQSRHNRKYWQRQPYLGLGLDAHSMLRTPSGAVRFSNTDDLDTYLAVSGTDLAIPLRILSNALSFGPSGPELARGEPPASLPWSLDHLTPDEALEEALFLGLRLNEGISLETLNAEFGQAQIAAIQPALAEAAEAGLLTVRSSADRHRDDHRIQLTPRGRVLSNEVFSRLLLPAVA